MATLSCPHCGQEVYEKLDTCPHCGGPMVPEADNDMNLSFSDIFKLANETDKKWFLGSTIAGAVIILIYFVTGVFTEGSLASNIIVFIFFTYLFASFFYGMHAFHPFRRFMPLGIIIGILLVWIVGIMVAIYGGFFFWYPRAIIRLIIHKPLLSEKDVQKLYVKNLL
ncbi:MAG: hypothetical protein E7306_04325 [Butyrivibrio sp.]|nr:hypothetical protein [Butyrivibrio sp.]